MLDHCSIFHKGTVPNTGFFYSFATAYSSSGGVVLWSRSFTPEVAHLASSPASPVNSLIREALIEGRTTDERYEKDGYAVKWTFVNGLELIFVVRIRLGSTWRTYPDMIPMMRLHGSELFSSHT